MNKFENMNVAELKAAAKDVGITGYSKMRKQELIDILTSHIPQDGKDPVGRFFDEVDDVLETVDDMTGFPDEAEQGLENLRAANRIGYSNNLEQEAARKTVETGVLHIVDRTGSISDEMLSNFEAEVADVMNSFGPSAEAVAEAQEVMKGAVNNVEKPVRFTMNRAMRRKQAALARRRAGRTAQFA